MNVCEDCPMRLFNDGKQYNLQGIGNPHFGRIIVIPNVDYAAYQHKSIGFSEQVKIIEEVLISSTGVLDILECLYIVPLIRCCDKLGCELTDDIYNKCIINLAEDFKHYNPKNIMLLGEAGKKFLNCNIKGYTNHVFISQHKRNYFINYSPLVKYTNEQLYEEFKTNIIKWFNSCITGVYDYQIQIVK